MARLRRLGTFGVAVLLMAALGSSVQAAGGPNLKAGYFDGRVVTMMDSPATTSADPNQVTFACYSLGPDPATHDSANAPILWAVLNDYATQHACPGAPTVGRHDHVLSTAPGRPGYTGQWTVVFALPGPNFDPSDMPFTSDAAVRAGIAAGKLIPVAAGLKILGPVVGG